MAKNVLNVNIPQAERVVELSNSSGRKKTRYFYINMIDRKVPNSCQFRQQRRHRITLCFLTTRRLRANVAAATKNSRRLKVESNKVHVICVRTDNWGEKEKQDM